VRNRLIAAASQGFGVARGQRAAGHQPDHRHQVAVPVLGPAVTLLHQHLHQRQINTVSCGGRVIRYVQAATAARSGEGPGTSGKAAIDPRVLVSRERVLTTTLDLPAWVTAESSAGTPLRWMSDS
jgi:hypothetical protein